MMFNQNFRAVVSDLDGTLLNEQHTIGEFTAHTFQRLEKRGIDIILATGRSEPDVRQIVASLGLSNATLITANGAKAHNTDGEVLHSNTLCETVAKNLLSVPFDRKNVVINTYQTGLWYVNEHVPDAEKYFKDSGFSYKIVDFSTHSVHDVEKIFFLGYSLEYLKPIEQHVKTHYEDHVSLTYSSENCLEIMCRGVSKGGTLENLLQERDYGLEDCVAFGDGLNDLEMLTKAGRGCVMGNADFRLLERTQGLVRIGRNRDESVASYLRALFNLSDTKA